MMDPRLSFKYGAALQVTVANPFLNYGTVDTFPGALRSRPTLAMSDLLKPYPQYLNMFQDWTNGRQSRYHTIELAARSGRSTTGSQSSRATRRSAARGRSSTTRRRYEASGRGPTFPIRVIA